MSPSWENRVRFSRNALFAYRPHQILVVPDPLKKGADLAKAEEILYGNQNPGLTATLPNEPPRTCALFEVPGIDVINTVARLRSMGVAAQPNHVLFADNNPFSGNPFSGNPFSGNPFSGNPFSGNPFSGNPFSGNPFSGNPFARLAYAKPHPSSDAQFARTGQGACLAVPDNDQKWPAPSKPASDAVRVAVLDVGLPEATQRPDLLQCATPQPLNPAQNQTLPLFPDPEPGFDEDGNGFVDRVAGHGMFVAGRVLQVEPGCDVRVLSVLTNAGDGDEATVIRALETLHSGGTSSEASVDLVNLSFGGYAMDDMLALKHAVSDLQAARTPTAQRNGLTGAQAGVVVVCSAGNDGTDLPPFPAQLPQVISVAALGPDGPAWFSNYGTWVSACASGVEVASTFFAKAEGAEHPAPNHDPDNYYGAARWSGTSFAAPLVVGKIARLMRTGGLGASQAAEQLLDGAGLARLPGLGTIVTD